MLYIQFNVSVSTAGLLYSAPEVLRHVTMTGNQKGDVYSFGIILHEIYGRSGPWGSSVFKPKGGRLFKMFYTCPLTSRDFIFDRYIVFLFLSRHRQKGSARRITDTSATGHVTVVVRRLRHPVYVRLLARASGIPARVSPDPDSAEAAPERPVRDNMLQLL